MYRSETLVAYASTLLILGNIKLWRLLKNFAHKTNNFSLDFLNIFRSTKYTWIKDVSFLCKISFAASLFQPKLNYVTNFSKTTHWQFKWSRVAGYRVVSYWRVIKTKLKGTFLPAGRCERTKNIVRLRLFLILLKQKTVAV